MGRAVICALVAALLCLMPLARAEEVIGLADQDLSGWEGIWSQYFPGESLTDFLQGILAGESPNVGGMLEAVLRRGSENWLRQGAAAVVRMLILVLLEVLLLYLSQGLKGASMARAGHMVVLAAALLYTGGQCLAALETALRALEGLSTFLNGAIPVLMPLLLASGWTATSGLLQPATLALTAMMDHWLRPALVHGVSMTMLLRMADCFSASPRLSGLIGMIKSALGWLLGLCLTGFVAVVGIQASAMMNYDSLALRSARYAVDAGIPGVGGLFADMVDTAVVSAQLIRGSLGIASLLALVLVCLEPVLHLVLLVLSLELSAALGSVLGKTPLSDLFHDQASLIKLMLYGLMTAALLVFMVVSLACMAGVRI